MSDETNLDPVDQGVSDTEPSATIEDKIVSIIIEKLKARQYDEADTLIEALRLLLVAL